MATVNLADAKVLRTDMGWQRVVTLHYTKLHDTGTAIRAPGSLAASHVQIGSNLMQPCQH